MGETGSELTLDDLPSPPLFKLVDPEGRDVFQETEVGGEGAEGLRPVLGQRARG